jgi:hypothetical protein
MGGGNDYYLVPPTDFNHTKRIRTRPWCVEGACTLGRGLVQPQAQRFAKAAGRQVSRKHHPSAETARKVSQKSIVEVWYDFYVSVIQFAYVNVLYSNLRERRMAHCCNPPLPHYLNVITQVCCMHAIIPHPTTAIGRKGDVLAVIRIIISCGLIRRSI